MKEEKKNKGILERMRLHALQMARRGW